MQLKPFCVSLIFLLNGDEKFKHAISLQILELIELNIQPTYFSLILSMVGHVICSLEYKKPNIGPVCNLKNLIKSKERHLILN